MVLDRSRESLGLSRNLSFIEGDHVLARHELAFQLRQIAEVLVPQK